MKRTLLLSFLLSSLLCRATAQGQSGPAPVAVQGTEPVSYASVTQLNGLLSQLEATSKNTQADLVKLRIEHWKTDTASKRQNLANVDSIQRNLQEALPEMMGQLRAAPEDLPATFKLYRNLDALYDVVGNVVESAGAFGSKDDFQSLSNDLNGFESTRKQVAQRIESLSTAKEAEIVRLRTELKAAQAVVPVTPPKKIVVDDNEPAKKPAAVKKKPVAKPTSPATPTAKPAAGQTQTPAPPQPQPQPATKPQ
jgi:Skp family chaperone for outer membrane proteins